MRLYTKRQARSFIAHAWSKECLELAKANECKKIAIPLIASGTFCFPKDKVLKIAVDEISTFLGENEMLVYTVVFDKASYSISEKLFTDITAYIDDNYVEKHFDFVGYSCNVAYPPSRSLTKGVECDASISAFDADERLLHGKMRLT